MPKPEKTEAVPARIFGLVARAAPVAVIFRRGPSKMTELLTWNLKTNEVTPGQWLRKAVYPMRSDVSPDGRHLIYFAATHMGGEDANWTAISRPPYFTALEFHGQCHAWNGGGLFLDNRRFWVNDPGWGRVAKARKVAHGLVRSPRAPRGVVEGQGECPGVHFPRLERDGWRLIGTDSATRHTEWIFAKDVRPNWTLQKRFVASLKERGPYGQVYWETHCLTGPDVEIALEDEWAEIWGRQILSARAGRLYRQEVHARSLGPSHEVADLNADRFCGVAAPYAGLERPRPARPGRRRL